MACYKEIKTCRQCSRVISILSKRIQETGTKSTHIVDFLPARRQVVIQALSVLRKIHYSAQ